MQMGILKFICSYCCDDRALRVVCCGAEGVFDVGRERDAEDDDALETFGHERGEKGYKLIDTPSFLAWETRYNLFFIWVVGDEDGVDEHALC